LFSIVRLPRDLRLRLAPSGQNACALIINRLLLDLSRHLQRFAGTRNLELNVLIQLRLRHHTSQRLDIRHVAAIEFLDHIAGLQLRLSCG
jgi:hypothetical protein